MKQEFKIFSHEMFGDIRTMTDECGETYFVGNDVAKALGYKNTRDALNKHVDSDDKGVAKCDTLGGEQNLVFVNESGLYALVLSSKLPQAQLTDMEIMALALQIQQKTIDEQHKAIEAMEPKAEYCDEVLESVSCFTTTQIAKELNMTVHDLTRLLMQRKVMYKQSGQFLLYADFARKGYARNRTHSHYDSEGELHTRTYLVWTERGRKFIHRVCKTEEIVIPFLLGVDVNIEEE